MASRVGPFRPSSGPTCRLTQLATGIRTDRVFRVIGINYYSIVAFGNIWTVWNARFRKKRIYLVIDHVQLLNMDKPLQGRLTYTNWIGICLNIQQGSIRHYFHIDGAESIDQPQGQITVWIEILPGMVL